MRPRTLITLTAATLAIAAPAAVAQASPAQAQQARNATSYLFVFDTETAQMAPIAGKKDAYTFTMPMRSVRHGVTWFTDRPDRDAGTLPMKAFVRLWQRPGADSFGQDPPNVALNFTLGGDERTFIATMSSPKIVASRTGDGTKSLQATMTAVPHNDLRGPTVTTGKLAKHAKRAHKARSASAARKWFRTPTTLTNASVVVDNFNAPDFSNCIHFPSTRTNNYWATFTSFSEYAAAWDGCASRIHIGEVQVVSGFLVLVDNVLLHAPGMWPTWPGAPSADGGEIIPAAETWLMKSCPAATGLTPPTWTEGTPQPAGWEKYADACDRWLNVVALGNQVCASNTLMALSMLRSPQACRPGAVPPCNDNRVNLCDPVTGNWPQVPRRANETTPVAPTHRQLKPHAYARHG